MQGFIWATLIFFILNLLIDIYFYQALKSDDISKNKIRKYIYFGLTIGANILFIIGFLTYKSDYKLTSTIARGVGFSFFVGKLIGIAPLIIDDIRRLFQLIFNQFRANKNPGNKISRAVFLKRSALGLGGIFTSMFLYGMIRGRHNYQKHRVNITLNRQPLKNKIKIIQISDFHLGSFTSDEPIKEVVNLINEENPDLIFFTGDLVNDFAEEAFPYIDILSQLKAKHGKYSILGNHDYGDYSIPKHTSEGEVKWRNNRLSMLETHEKMGFDLLLNENRILDIDGERINLIGVENWGAGRWTKYGDLELALEGIDSTFPTLLLSHDPSHWEAQVIPHQKPIDLTFSGHTHGMQFGIEIPGFKWSLIQYKYPQWAGLYEKGQEMIYVNRGVGYVGYPGRVGIMPEISVMELM